MIIKFIPGYEELYSIGQDGRVFSFRSSKFLKHRLNNHGYHQVRLYREGKSKECYVHRLVLLTFEGPSKLQINHRDGDKTNNRLRNLEYCTSSDNLKHAHRIGLIDQRGSRNPASKLTEELVLEIKIKLENKQSMYSIAREYSVNDETIRSIKLNKTWKHVTME